jgi:putative hydrolase of the HAD superfamily
METVEAITFDFGGTLANGELDKENYKGALMDYIFRLGYSGGKTRLSKARVAMLERLRKAQEKNRELRFEELYRGLLFELGLHPTQERLDYIEQLYYHFFRIDLVPDLRDILVDLSGRYNLAIVSNVISNASHLILQKFDLEQYFDSIVLSRDLGIRKPDPEIFNFTLENLGVHSSKAVHVGDSLKYDVQGAKNAGMKTVWIKGCEEPINIRPDFIISKVTELPKLF